MFWTLQENGGDQFTVMGKVALKGKKGGSGAGEGGVPGKEESRCKGPEAGGCTTRHQNCRCPGVERVGLAVKQPEARLRSRELGRAWTLGSTARPARERVFCPTGSGELQKDFYILHTFLYVTYNDI